MKFFLSIRTYLLIILYNTYFLCSLACGYTEVCSSSEPWPATAYWTLPLDPTAGQPLLKNDNNESSFKIKPVQTKKEEVIVGTQFSALKTYTQHNNLHYNIPLICYKFAVSQHTADG